MKKQSVVTPQDIDDRFSRLSSLLWVVTAAAGNNSAMVADDRGHLEYVLNNIIDDVNELHTDALRLARQAENRGAR